MNRLRAPVSAAFSKATPQTLCQKCLKRDNYECKGNAQERPYASRPSRSQQLANPKLAPSLSSDNPELLLRKAGVADEELAKKEAERGRKRKLEDDEDDDVANGYRSRSSSSGSSVSSISTNKSRSASPDPYSMAHTGQSQLMSNVGLGRTRRNRSLSSSMSYDSDLGQGQRRRGNTGRQSSYDRRRSLSRGRNEKDGERSNAYQTHAPAPGRQRSISSTRIPHEKRSVSKGWSKRRRRASRSPEDRGRGLMHRDQAMGRRTESPLRSRDRSLVARNRKSMTPQVSGPGHENLNPKNGGHQPVNGGRASFRERSLSPFSKRAALTRQMQLDR